MIQRIQSIYLSVVALAGGVMTLISESIIAIVANANEEVILYAISTILALIALFSFKNRRSQININTINIGLNALLIGLSSYYLLNLPGGESFPEKGIWLIVPVANIILLIVANVYIHKDIELVKSVDRLR